MVNITPDALFQVSRLHSSVHLSSLVVSSGCTEGGVRLAGGETVMEGRVEVCHNQIWWAVSGSSSYWDFSDATVVCRHLHYPVNCKLSMFLLRETSFFFHTETISFPLHTDY